MDMSYSKCASALKKAVLLGETDPVKAYGKMYAVLVVSRANGHANLEEEAISWLISVYKERRGARLFLAGEFMERLKAAVQGLTLDSDRKCLQEILGVPIEKRARVEVEQKAFQELEPALKTSAAPTRGGRGNDKKRVREARGKAQQASREYILQKRRDDREYSEKLRRMEESLKRQ
ncbi:uncharacterized protein NEMAJ01_0119 [Nematocida major]|uniref:uncharacterized protein n=1 Tax=Nematocida major TaxID=1912982 RepID=UPI002008E7DE|nr:uncharacterized protein NEMAJ01_0119 [Nematocida major]KAH9385223.1 hypothetical protein NEMAJ01_0119 [Nematocida major]